MPPQLGRGIVLRRRQVAQEAHGLYTDGRRAIVAGPPGPLRVTIRLAEEGTPAACPSVGEFRGPLHALARVWRHAFTAVVALLCTECDGAVEARPPPTT
eukprot:17571-Eustigmatos_ZCMA.PRE.1